MTETCANHPDHPAAEHCEICRRPLCGLCLWYGDDGRRLCAEHARAAAAEGVRVVPPEAYAEGIGASLVAQTAVEAKKESWPYRGNREDVVALVAAVVGLVTLISCFGGVYCLPVFGAVLGLAAFADAGRAADPKRTRRLAAVGIALSIIVVLCLALYLVGVFGAMALLAASGSSGP